MALVLKDKPIGKQKVQIRISQLLQYYPYLLIYNDVHVYASIVILVWPYIYNIKYVYTYMQYTYKCVHGFHMCIISAENAKPEDHGPKQPVLVHVGAKSEFGHRKF